MIGGERRVLTLKEYEPVLLERDQLPDTLGELLWSKYSTQIAVEFPSPKTRGRWELTAQGWVGYVPLAPELVIAIQPKVPLANLFGMLEYAYQLDELQFPPGVLVSCETLEELYERLAHFLARRVLDRGRLGFYRAYLADADQLPFVRGKVDMAYAVRYDWRASLQCEYQEHTADIVDNQILAWTLSRILDARVCTERSLPTIRQAYRVLRGAVSLTPLSPDACLGRLYNRLNQDYEPLHALSRFFLEHSGPGHGKGDTKMIPFLVNMARLFELFVAAWLRRHLPVHLALDVQERVNVGEAGELRFQIDIVLYDVKKGSVLSVLDTKYKVGAGPSTDDVSQVVTYAELKDSPEAVLVYPAAMQMPVDELIGDIRVRSLAFELAGDLEQAGKTFLDKLLSRSP